MTGRGGAPRRRAPPAALTIFRKELLELLRDRRAVLFAYVLPLVLYPALFLGVSVLPRTHENDLGRRLLTIGAAGEVEELRAALVIEDLIELAPSASPEDDVRSGAVSLAVTLERDDAGSDGRGRLASVRYLATSAPGREALARVRVVLDRLASRLLEARFAAQGLEVDIAALGEVDASDVSRADERSGASLGRILPLLLVLILLTGGAFAAIDLVAGEKERGTLETLCAQAVSKRSIVAGKFLVVLVSSLASVGLNLAGLAVSLSIGFTATGLDGTPLSMPGAGVLAVCVLLLVPLSVLTSAVLLTVSAFARSYREAQGYLLPLTLAALLPVGISLAPQATLSGPLAWVPIANVALAIREALGNTLAIPAVFVVFAATSVHALVMLRIAAGVLEREDIVLALEPAPLSGDLAAEAHERRALVFGACMLLGVYFAGTWLQGGGVFTLPVGLAITLWGVVLVPAICFARRSRRPLADALGLRRPRPGALAIAAFLAACSLVLVSAYWRLQESFLPLPKDFERELAKLMGLGDLDPVVVFALLAVSPGICEELLWRGAFQSELERGGRRGRSVVLSGVFFGLFHLSVFRLVPTAAIGLLLACVRQRTGSLFPAMVLHVSYNAAAVFVLPGMLDDASALAVIHHPLALAAAAGGVYAGLCRLRPAATA